MQLGTLKIFIPVFIILDNELMTGKDNNMTVLYRKIIEVVSELTVLCSPMCF
jgi:hypothetical protein